MFKKQAIRREVSYIMLPVMLLYTLSSICIGDGDIPRFNSRRGVRAAAFSIRDNPYKYSGYYCDPESGMYYCQARYYSPELMRFINRDTYDLSNRYAYCDGDPINNVDPTGHYSEDGMYMGTVMNAGATVCGIAMTIFSFLGTPIVPLALGLAIASDVFGVCGCVTGGLSTCFEGVEYEGARLACSIASYACFGMSILTSVGSRVWLSIAKRRSGLRVPLPNERQSLLPSAARRGNVGPAKSSRAQVGSGRHMGDGVKRGLDEMRREMNENGIECKICFDNKKNLVICCENKHLMCEDCLATWQKEADAKCPMCRGPIKVNRNQKKILLALLFRGESPAGSSGGSSTSSAV